MSLRVFLVDWYDHFTISNPYWCLLEIALKDTLVLEKNVSNADIILIGAYGNKHCLPEIQRAKGWRLFVTGENRVPDYRYCHHSLSFCRYDFGKRNCRFPVWMLNLALFGDCKTTLSRQQTDELIRFNRPLSDFSYERRDLSRIVTVFNNPEVHRIMAFIQLYKRGIIEGVGPVFGNYTKWGDEVGYVEKLSILKKYGYCLCMENSTTDGYYTEKVLHSRVAGCIPIVYSDPNIKVDFCTDGLINLYDYDDYDAFINTIVECTSNTSAYAKLNNSPIFSKTPSIEPVCTFLNVAYESFLQKGINDDFSFLDSTKHVSRELRHRIQRFLSKVTR